MPAPKTASLYEAEYFRILYAARQKFEAGETFFSIPFPDSKTAEKVRFRFYSFRNAIRREAAKHPDLEVRKERQEQQKVADTIRIRALPITGGTELRFENAVISEDTATAILSSFFDDLDNDTVPEQDATSEEFTEANDRSLKSLGIDKPDSASDLFEIE